MEIVEPNDADVAIAETIRVATHDDTRVRQAQVAVYANVGVAAARCETYGLLRLNCLSGSTRYQMRKQFHIAGDLVFAFPLVGLHDHRTGVCVAAERQNSLLWNAGCLMNGSSNRRRLGVGEKTKIQVDERYRQRAIREDERGRP